MDYIIKDLFEKAIDRPIEGVIKADDTEGLRNELEEYVITKEIASQLENFLEVYTNFHAGNSNGVWISGFFGSGKSHLLKMLALVLENKSLEGNSPLDFFTEKSTSNTFLKGRLQKLSGIPAKSILFNIDQKTDVINKGEADALLAVFVKVFDEMCGYYGKQSYIAQFERDLDNRGLLGSFKSVYKSKSGMEWELGREQALFEGANIASAYAQITGDDISVSSDILDKYSKLYTLSIEDFANQVHEYIQKQENPNFRLNFFVDEVGQYIAENIKLMTNLQTIAESLMTKCKGKAWIIVTAQEDMDSIIGEMNARHANDFSKIQARFANRMKLTSANVAEVIQKRLLEKKEDVKSIISILYKTEHNNFKTLFHFGDASLKFKLFESEEDFVELYPFIPYQFDLFQSAIKSLSYHNAFEGHHNSVGERSMLGVFQQVLKLSQNGVLGVIPSFDLMFEGIRNTLRSNIQSAIFTAERNLENTFAIKILKALFLVKYINGFKATPRNICVLMQESFTQNPTELKRKVDEALNLLEQQTYIQNTGEQFEYLTNKEKDIEQEIKNTYIDNLNIIKFISEIVFDKMFGTSRKIRHTNNQDYLFARKIDGQIDGREQELTIHIVTPFYSGFDSNSILLENNINELLIKLNAHSRLAQDISHYLKSEQYRRQNPIDLQEGEKKHILEEKGKQNTKRLELIQAQLHEAIITGDFFVKGQPYAPAGSGAKEKVEYAFQELITKAYTNLNLLHGKTYTENQIAEFVLYESDLVGISLNEAEQEVLSFILANDRNGVKTTVKAISDRFEHIPYGWYNAAVLCLVARLFSYGKIEISQSGTYLDAKQVASGLKNSRTREELITSPVQDYTPLQVRTLKEFYTDFLKVVPDSVEPKKLAENSLVLTKEKYKSYFKLLPLCEDYPFNQMYKESLAKIESLTNKSYTWFLTDLKDYLESLLDLKEYFFDKIEEFISGQGKKVFDKANLLLKENRANLSHLSYLKDLTEKRDIEHILKSSDCYKGDSIRRLTLNSEKLLLVIKELVQSERANAIEAIKNRQRQLVNQIGYILLDVEEKAQLEKPFSVVLQKIEHEDNIDSIRESKRFFEDNDYPQILSLLDGFIRTKESSKGGQASSEQERIEYVSHARINVSFDKAYLSSEDDLEQYLENVKQAYLAELKNGKRIQV